MLLFYGEELLAPYLSYKLEDHICIFCIFSPACLIWKLSSTYVKFRMCHAIETGTHLS